MTNSLIRDKKNMLISRELVLVPESKYHTNRSLLKFNFFPDRWFSSPFQRVDCNGDGFGNIEMSSSTFGVQLGGVPSVNKC